MSRRQKHSPDHSINQRAMHLLKPKLPRLKCRVCGRSARSNDDLCRTHRPPIHYADANEVIDFLPIIR